MSIKHPHSGGQGKKGKGIIGGPAKDKWGNKIGKRTRKNRKTTSKYIIKRRPSKHRFKTYKTII
jgi:ribosomal protein L2